MVGIYKIISPSGRVYIGQSINIEKRKIDYANLLCKGQRLIYYSLKKYGWEAHKFEVLHELPDDAERSVLNYYEKLYIKQFKDAGTPMLNIADGGFGGAQPKEIAKRTAEKNKGNVPWNKGMKGFRAGRITSDETKKRISEAHKGKVISEDERRRLSTINIGRTQTEEHRRVNSEWQKKKKLSPEHKEKIRQSLMGHKPSQSTRKLWSEQRKGKTRKAA